MICGLVFLAGGEKMVVGRFGGGSGWSWCIIPDKSAKHLYKSFKKLIAMRVKRKINTLTVEV